MATAETAIEELATTKRNVEAAQRKERARRVAFDEMAKIVESMIEDELSVSLTRIADDAHKDVVARHAQFTVARTAAVLRRWRDAAAASRLTAKLRRFKQAQILRRWAVRGVPALSL